MDVISSIGDTAASLGLISTLVFSIAVNIVLQSANDAHGHEGQMMSMCVAISTSAYTTTFSLLEYYYTVSIRRVCHYVMNEIPEASKQDTTTEIWLDAPREKHPASVADGAGDQEEQLQALTAGAYGELIKVCIDGFASFNEMRQWAKNATWFSICSILLSAVTKFHSLARISNHDQKVLPLCWTSAAFFCGALCFTLIVYVAGFRSWDIKVYGAVSVVGLAVCYAVGYFYDPDYDMPATLCSCILFAGVVVVLRTVQCYRDVFMPLVLEHLRVY
jgi:hypothetical protein